MVVVDLETTSDNPSTAEPITGHFIHVVDGSVVRTLDWKCRPRIWGKEAEEAVAIHGIKKEEAMAGPMWINAMRELWQWLPKHQVHFACHARRRMFGKQVTFDHAVLMVQFFDVGQHYEFARRFPPRKILSTHSMAQKIITLPNYGLANVCKAMELEFDSTQHHGAEYDAQKCLQLVRKFATKLDLEKFALEDYEYTKEESEHEPAGGPPKKVRKKKNTA